MKKHDIPSPRYWLIVGRPKNWRTAFEHGNIWGLKETQQHLWTDLREKDRLIFYATMPVGGIIGYGRVRTKFRQGQPLWPQELYENRIIWPLRFEFDIDYCLPSDKWTAQRVISNALQPRAGFQLLNHSTAEQLVRSLKAPPRAESAAVAQELEFIHDVSQETAPSHDQLKEALLEIGRLQSFIVDSEYSFDIGRLDVVWRRVQQSVPTYVFEIQIGGNLHQALSKLKHAFDLWNSHVFLVCDREDLKKANQLLSGTFHEIGSRVKLIDCRQTMELLTRKRSYHDLEENLGIL